MASAGRNGDNRDVAGVTIIPIHGTKNLEGLIDGEFTTRLGIKTGVLTDNTVTATMRDRSGKRRTGEEKKLVKLIQRFGDQGLPVSSGQVNQCACGQGVGVRGSPSLRAVCRSDLARVDSVSSHVFGPQCVSRRSHGPSRARRPPAPDHRGGGSDSVVTSDRRLLPDVTSVSRSHRRDIGSDSRTTGPALTCAERQKRAARLTCVLGPAPASSHLMWLPFPVTLLDTQKPGTTTPFQNSIQTPFLQ